MSVVSSSDTGEPMDAAQDLGPLFRLVYRSRSSILTDRREDELTDILGVSWLNNAGMGVTGALLAWEDAFVQVLEGDEAAVRALYEAIRIDPRHEQVVTLDADSVPFRVFGSWSMARVGSPVRGGGTDIPVDTEGGDPSAVRTGDPGRDTMLALMCEYARLDVETR